MKNHYPIDSNFFAKKLKIFTFAYKNTIFFSYLQGVIYEISVFDEKNIPIFELIELGNCLENSSLFGEILPRNRLNQDSLQLKWYFFSFDTSNIYKNNP